MAEHPLPKLLPSLGQIVRALDVALMVDTDVEVEETLERLAEFFGRQPRSESVMGLCLAECIPCSFPGGDMHQAAVADLQQHHFTVLEADSLGAAVDELLDPLNYLKPNQEIPPTGEGGPEYVCEPPILVGTPPPGADHSPEPWGTTPYSGPSVPFFVEITFGDGSGCVAMFGGKNEAEARANADRTMKTVNGMAGISTEMLSTCGELLRAMFQMPVRVSGDDQHAIWLQMFLNHGKEPPAPVDPADLAASFRHSIASRKAMAGVLDPEKLMAAVRATVDAFRAEREGPKNESLIEHFLMLDAIVVIAAALKGDG